MQSILTITSAKNSAKYIISRNLIIEIRDISDEMDMKKRESSWKSRINKTVLVELLILALIGVPSAIHYQILWLNEPGPTRQPDNWELTFVDEFDTATVNTTIWSKNYPESWPDGGHTHNHRAYMDADNVYIEDGIMRIRADNETHPDAPNPRYAFNRWLSYNFTSGLVLQRPQNRTRVHRPRSHR
mgnify:CR=1 FL=1